MLVERLLAQGLHTLPMTPAGSFATLSISDSRQTSSVWSVPTLIVSPPSPPPTLRPAQFALPSIESKDSFRSLSLVEARQLTMLLHQALFPVRTSPKGMMTASIKLAIELHEAGIRWDRQRMVMGLHLKGIWEEGEKLETDNEMGVDGHRAMERYIQGSFLSIAEDPHPLDTRPIPIELTASSTRYSSLPKLTLHSGLAHALGATAAVGAVADPALGRVLADATCRPGQPMGEGKSFPLGADSGDHGGAGRLRARKKAGLKVKTCLPIDPREHSATTLSAHALVSGHYKTRAWQSKLLRVLVRPTNFRPKHRSAVLIKRTKQGFNERGVGGVALFKQSLGMGYDRATRGVVPRTAKRVVEGGWELR